LTFSLYRKDFGIQCVIAPSFAEIFKNNSMQNGMLPVSIDQDQCRALAKEAEAGAELEIDLEKQEIRTAQGATFSFVIDPFRRHCLLNGLDDIALTLQKVREIEVYEQKRSGLWPWLDGLGYVMKQGKPIVTSNARAKDW
jgi:3-isopropylmalate dehydratase